MQDNNKSAIRLVVKAHDAGKAAIDAMRDAGVACLAIKASGKGALKPIIAGYAAERGVKPETAANYVSACMRVAKDKSLDTVRAAHGVKKAAPAKGGRFSAVKAAKNAEVRLGTDKAIKMAEEILRRNGYTIG